MASCSLLSAIVTLTGCGPHRTEEPIDGDVVDRVDVRAAPVDTDQDGITDDIDLDDDDDGIPDDIEGELDPDRDGLPNRIDHDSDGDGILDSQEAGIGSQQTPRECDRELDGQLADGHTIRADGIPDYLDADSDNDGLPDGAEHMEGTQPCGSDSDGDGDTDGVEVAFCRRAALTSCATDPMRTVPSSVHHVVVRPGDSPTIPFECDLSITSVDVFFLFESSTANAAVVRAVTEHLATADGLLPRLAGVIPDPWIGLGHFTDFPISPYGADPDRPIAPLCDGPPGSGASSECVASGGTYGGITLRPIDRSVDLDAAARAITTTPGGDGATSAVEALYEVASNGGLFDRMVVDPCRSGMSGPGCWVRPAACPAGRWGYPCFRRGAATTVVLFAQGPFHNGSRDPSSALYSSPYAGLAPAPHNFDEMNGALSGGDVRVVSVVGPGPSCVGTLPFDHTAGVCFDLWMTAFGTQSLDESMEPWWIDAPGNIDTDAARSTLLDRVADDVRASVTNRRRDANLGVGAQARADARDIGTFFLRSSTACSTPADETCWTSPPGIAHADAIVRRDLTTYYGVIAGTTVRFTGQFWGEPVLHGPRVMAAAVDCRVNGTATSGTDYVVTIAAPSP